jgi:hypothetical protein
MGFPSKRLAKKVPSRLESLEALRTAMAALGASSKLDADQMSGLRTLAPNLDTGRGPLHQAVWPQQVRRTGRTGIFQDVGWQSRE